MPAAASRGGSRRSYLVAPGESTAVRGELRCLQVERRLVMSTPAGWPRSPRVTERQRAISPSRGTKASLHDDRPRARSPRARPAGDCDPRSRAQSGETLELLGDAGDVRRVRERPSRSSGASSHMRAQPIAVRRCGSRASRSASRTSRRGASGARRRERAMAGRARVGPPRGEHAEVRAQLISAHRSAAGRA